MKHFQWTGKFSKLCRYGMRKTDKKSVNRRRYDMVKHVLFFFIFYMRLYCYIGRNKIKRCAALNRGGRLNKKRALSVQFIGQSTFQTMTTKIIFIWISAFLIFESYMECGDFSLSCFGYIFYRTAPS